MSRSIRRSFCRLLGLLVLSLPAVVMGTSPSVHLTGSFARSTQVDTRHALTMKPAIQLWDSWQGSDKLTGTFDYGPFKAEQFLELLVAGFPNGRDARLQLHRDADGAVLRLQPSLDPGFHWTRNRWKIPSDWVGRSCHLLAEDASSNEAGWVGVSLPLAPSGEFVPAAIESALQLAVFLLLLIPGLAVVGCFPGLSDRRALAVLLLGSGGLAYALVFGYFLSPEAGRAASFGFYLAAAAVLVVRRREICDRLLRPDFLVPCLLAATVAVLYFAGGFLYGGIEAPEGMPMARFCPSMPPDPLLPYWLAKVFATGSPLHPFFLDWLSSDRPPLQAGLYLLVWPVVPARYAFETVGIAAQSWVWIGFWAFLRSLRVSRRASACVLAICIFSGMFFLNSVFCWPKLLPAAFLLLATGLLWDRAAETPRPDVARTTLAAACCALAFLGHGGSAFGVAGIALVLLLQRRLPRLIAVGLGVVTFAAIMTPWTLYQKLADPPGDRLIKYHLADHKPIDPRSSLTVIREAYRQTPWPEILRNKLANLEALGGSANAEPVPTVTAYVRSLFRGEADREAAASLRSILRDTQFRHYFQALGPALLGLFALGIFWRRLPADDRRAAALALLLFIASSIVWCLLMFQGGSTVIHQSSYFTGACLFTATGIGISALKRRAALILLAVTVVAFYWLWMSGPLAADAAALMPSAFAGFGWIVAAATVAIIALLAALARAKEDQG